MSLLNNDYPQDRMEILVIDGMSDDGTWAIVKALERVFPVISSIQNEDKTKYKGLNTALTVARGDSIVIADAHAEYPKNYIERLVEQHAENVGGVQVEIPRKRGLIGNAVVLARTVAFGLFHDR